MRSATVFMLLILAIIGGLVLGLALGWIVWPVEWVDASPEHLRVEWQTDWLNMAIDSYSVNQNAELAAQRYNALGQDAASTLATIEQNPTWVSGQSVAEFTAAINQTGSGTATSSSGTESTSATTSASKTPLFTYILIVLLFALLAVILLVILVFRLFRRREEPIAPAISEPVAVSVMEEAPGEPQLSAIEVEEPIAPVISEPAAVPVVEEAPEEPQLAAAEFEVPERAAEIVVSEGAEAETGAPGMAALAGAALVGAAVGMEGEGQEAADQEQKVEEALSVESQLPEVEPDATAPSVAAVAWALESEHEEPVEDELPAEVPVESVGEEWQPETAEEELPSDFYGKHNRNIVEVEGIGEAYASKLSEVGIGTVQALLQQCATSKGREELAEKTGISSKLILEWANHADLMRVQGIGPQWSDLLEMAGVNTVREMAMRNPKNLHQKLVEVNDEKKLVRQTPTLPQVEEWVEQAKELPKILTY